LVFISPPAIHIANGAPLRKKHENKKVAGLPLAILHRRWWISANLYSGVFSDPPTPLKLTQAKLIQLSGSSTEVVGSAAVDSTPREKAAVPAYPCVSWE
jgi:hypothetical protein